jgi:integrase
MATRDHRGGTDRPALHDLRHTAGTLAAAAGATTKELMERLGHTSHRGAPLPHVMTGRHDAIAAALDQLAGGALVSA